MSRLPLSRPVQRWALPLLLLLATGCTSVHTPPITDAQGRPLAGSIARLEPLVLGGVRQWVLLRGADATAPLLLKLHGGPGQAEMATVPFNRALEQDFVVVEWDQRGAGKSAEAIEPDDAMTIERIVADTIELSERLLQRFGQRRLVLVGHSWGSVIGLLAVQRRPELYRAFVSTGQIVHLASAGRLSHQALVDEATRRGDADALATLQRIGPPPYLGESAAPSQQAYLDLLQRLGGLWQADEPFDRIGWMLRAPEYAWPEKLAYTAAAERSAGRLMPQLAAIDLRQAVPSVQVPVYFAAGRHDRLQPPALSRAYFDALQAPAKHWAWFETAAHFPQWEEPAHFHALLRQVTYDTAARPCQAHAAEPAPPVRWRGPLEGEAPQALRGWAHQVQCSQCATESKNAQYSAIGSGSPSNVPTR